LKTWRLPLGLLDRAAVDTADVVRRRARGALPEGELHRDGAGAMDADAPGVGRGGGTAPYVYHRRQILLAALLGIGETRKGREHDENEDDKQTTQHLFHCFSPFCGILTVV